MFGKVDFSSVIRRNRIPVLIGSILAIVIGVLCIVMPWTSAGFLVWIAILLIGVLGLLGIIKFIFPGKGNLRSPLALVTGILVCLCVVAIFLAAYFANDVIIDKDVTLSGFEGATLRILFFAEILFGVFSIVENIFSLCSAGVFPSEERGWVIGKSILGIVVGTLMLIFPSVAFTVGIIIGGAYLLIMGIVLLVVTIKLWKYGGKKEEVKETDVKDVK